MMQKILITGGAGYIGSHVAEILTKYKNKIFIVDNLCTGFKKLLNNSKNFFPIKERDIHPIKVINPKTSAVQILCRIITGSPINNEIIPVKTMLVSS